MTLSSSETVTAGATMIEALPDNITPLDAVFVLASALGLVLGYAIRERAIGAGRAQQTMDLAMRIVEELAGNPDYVMSETSA